MTKKLFYRPIYHNKKVDLKCTNTYNKTIIFIHAKEAEEGEIYGEIYTDF